MHHLRSKSSQQGRVMRWSCLWRSVSPALRNAIAVLAIIPVLAVGDDDAEPNPVSDFYITVTASDLCLCGEGFGGMYGCIDEAISREVKTVVISASSDATVETVQSLINAVHSVGFEEVGFVTFYEPDD